jgi:hypothetical protein
MFFDYARMEILQAPDIWDLKENTPSVAATFVLKRDKQDALSLLQTQRFTSG